MSSYPEIFRVRQALQAARVNDVAGEVASQLARLPLAEHVQPGQSVAITAGSRGIANIHVILRAIVEHFKGLGAEPFLVPAMGSHGGGTAEGQVAVLKSYGITEAFCGCPIRAGMETVVICRAPEGFPVYFDRHASQADHVVVCGRVKPHTKFVGDIESGLMKMMLIGLGKHDGAKTYHRAIQDYSFEQILHSVGREVLSRCRIVAGVAIVENALDETAKIAAVLPEQLVVQEKQLLEHARRLLPRLPFDTADVLLVDEIGKNISGTGMDTNVVGRKYNDHTATGDERPVIKRIVVRSLTEATHGNATGIGMAEFCLSRALRQMDVGSTRVNCVTAGHPTAAMPPLDYPTDREVLDAALQTIGLTEPADARLLWVQNTLRLAEVECSVAYWDEARSRDDLEIISDPRPLPLNAQGNLPATCNGWS